MPSLKANGRRLNGKGSGWISKILRVAIYLRDRFTCQYCGRDLHDAHPREVTLDHLTPQCRGGSHDPKNLITACLACNSRRQHTPWTRYAPQGAVLRIRKTIRRVPNRALAKALINGDVSRAEVLR
jgi:5-methylcytosine-specific restriction endonuclease McrA